MMLLLWGILVVLGVSSSYFLSGKKIVAKTFEGD